MVRRQRGKRQNGQKEDKRFEGKGGVGVLHEQRGGQVEQWKYTGRRSPRRESQCYKQIRSSRSESCQEF